jgi:hypothetical protein
MLFFLWDYKLLKLLLLRAKEFIFSNNQEAGWRKIPIGKRRKMEAFFTVRNGTREGVIV